MIAEIESIEKIEEIKLGPSGWSRGQRWRRVAAEGLGVFAIVFTAGGGSIANQLSGGQVGLVGAAFISGLAVMAMIYALGHICGAHFNPAVTLAFATVRYFPWREVPGYLFGQLAGAVIASTTLKLLFGEVARLGATTPAGNVWQALVLEAIITFFLMFVILAVATDGRAVSQTSGLAIGVTVTFAILLAGPITGASMNPARSFGPALLSGTWQDWWVYWLGPVVGAVLGAAAYQLLRGEEANQEGGFTHERH